MRKPNIVFVGGNCSGKTTLAEWVIKKYNYEYSYLNQTRRLINDQYDGSLINARKDNFNFQKELLNHKTYWETKHKSKGFVSDRSTLDNLGYLLAFNNNLDTTEVLHYQHKATIHARKTYDIIFCINPLFDVQQDLLSPSDICEQLRVFYIVKGLLFEMDGHMTFDNTVYILDTDMGTRKYIIEQSIFDYYKTKDKGQKE